jgi:hypothetical protein
MEKRTTAIATGIILFAFFLAGCGLIGGAFTEPSPDEGMPAATTEPGQTALPGELVTETASAPVAQLPQGCENALAVARSELGETKCVGGLVFRAWQDHGTFFIDFSEKLYSFYMVGQDWQSPFVVHPGDCIYAEGKIVEIDRVPSMGISPYSLKQCPGSTDLATAAP